MDFVNSVFPCRHIGGGGVLTHFACSEKFQNITTFFVYDYYSVVKNRFANKCYRISLGQAF
jgi:hypothetical protein